MAEAKRSDNVVEETWLAYAFRDDAGESAIQSAVARVEAHYGALVAESLERSESLGPRHGMAFWQRADDRLSWPLWTRAGNMAAAFTAVPIGWERVVASSPATAAPDLAAVLDRRPREAAKLNAPFVAGIRNEAEGRLTIVNDSLGIGRLYEIETEAGWAWSNRLGALPIFAGVRPVADARGWGVLAAAGWFLGDTTPIAGTRKVPAGTVVAVASTAGATSVSSEQTAHRETELVAPRPRPGNAVADAGAGVRDLAGSLSEVWRVPPVVDLTGGRDSRVSAAAAISAGLDADFKTVDNEAGEVDVVRDLIAAAPRRMRHTVNAPESEETADDLASRLAAIHLVHDGMRNPQEVRRPTVLPHAGTVPPSISGHGGEIGHGFYYANRRQVWQLRHGGRDGLSERLMTAARRRHSAARPESYAAYGEECERVLATGTEVGVKGPSLLDYFYLAERLPHRSGLGARSGRYSACVVPAFVRASFDLRPGDRLGAKLHAAVVADLVPEWKAIPFFVSGSGAMPATRRARIWEKEEHAAEITQMIEEGRGWPEMLDPDRIREIWAEVRDGGGSADYEHVFYRLAWRAGYEEHLERLADAALAAPART